MLEYASKESIGRRGAMEDRHGVIQHKDSLVGFIFDGHSGDETAEYANQYFTGYYAGIFVQHDEGDPVESFRKAFHRVHKQVADSGLRGGACALAFQLDGDTLTVANAGDSHLAVVDFFGRSKFLSIDHRLDNPKECQRVVKAGAYIRHPYIFDPLHFEKGGLMPTRAIGDHGHEQVGIIPDPDISQHKFSAGYLVAACDGLWDVMHAWELQPYCSGTAAEVCERLFNEALNIRHTTDNLTIIVVRK